VPIHNPQATIRKGVITRFAPSPTGHLHLGHLVNAVLVWHHAREAGGIVRLRIEDHDRDRARPEYEQSVLDDLEWLGLVPDTPPIEAFRHGRCHGRQSDHPERYEAAMQGLADDGLVYACACSRAELAERLGPAGPDLELPYDGYCRDRKLRFEPGRGLRVRLGPGTETFDDLSLGPQSQSPDAQCGDLLIRDRVGFWTYQFAVTVDDMVERITHVIRGADLLASTGRQIRLARLLGRPAPARFLHHRLLFGPDGTKLSKSRGDTGVRELRAAGVAPSAVLAQARELAGLRT